VGSSRKVNKIKHVSYNEEVMEGRKENLLSCLAFWASNDFLKKLINTREVMVGTRKRVKQLWDVRRIEARLFESSS